MVCAGLAGCLWWSRRDDKRQQGQPVAKSASGVPFNMDLDSARGPGPEDPEDPKELVVSPEPDHAPAGEGLHALPVFTHPPMGFAYLSCQLTQNCGIGN